MKFIAIAAITLDGRIAKGANHMSDWTSKEDKVFMRALLDKCDLVIVGNNTYKTAIKPLSKRNCLVFSRSASKLISKSALLKYVDPKKTNVKKLVAKLKYKKVAILGGAQTYALCLQKNLLDEIYLTIEPLVFGKGINLFDNDKFLEKKFKLHSVKKLNKQGTVLLRYIK
jgi:dihydrofolate reductase